MAGKSTDTDARRSYGEYGVGVLAAGFNEARSNSQTIAGVAHNTLSGRKCTCRRQRLDPLSIKLSDV